jgi:hypothetical protein
MQLSGVELAKAGFHIRFGPGTDILPVVRID